MGTAGPCRADVGCTPFEVAVKEAQEKTSLLVQPVRLLALFDKRKQAHPPQPWYVYKAFIQCDIVGGALQQETAETVGTRWFRREELAVSSYRPIASRSPS